MLRWLQNFALFWYDFIVGDDWTVAAGVIVALALTGLLVHVHASAWWLPPIAVILLLGASVWRVARTSSPV